MSNSPPKKQTLAFFALQPLFPCHCSIYPLSKQSGQSKLISYFPNFICQLHIKKRKWQVANTEIKEPKSLRSFHLKKAENPLQLFSPITLLPFYFNNASSSCCSSCAPLSEKKLHTDLSMEFDLENPFENFHDRHSEALSSLFLLESDHIPSQNYLHSLKARGVDISVRREVISLISQFSYAFDPVLSYLAINYVDRFLANQGILQPKPWALRLLAISCFSLAAKMMKTQFSVTGIQCDGGAIFEAQTIQRMEGIILGALQWRMRSITPFSFIPFFIDLFNLKDPKLKEVLKDRAIEFIFKSQADIKLLEFKPSIIAASALLSASHELLPLQYPSFLKAISDCSYVNKENMLDCHNLIQNMAMDDGYESVIDMVSSSDTAVNVLDHHFVSSESEKINGTTAAAAATTLRQEKDIKRKTLSSEYSNNYTAHISQTQNCRN